MGYLGRPGKMGSTSNDYNQVDTSYLLHNVILLKRKSFLNLLGTFLRKLGKSEQETVAKEKSCMIQVYPRSTMIRAKHSFKNG